MKEALGACPLCGKELIVSEYTCTECRVVLKGDFRRCDICRLSKEQLHFVRVFLKCEGNIRGVEKAIGISYPTIKARLAKINQILDMGDFSEYVTSQNRLQLLQDFQEGKIALDDVLDRI